MGDDIKCYANPAIAALFQACPDHDICNRCGCCDEYFQRCDSCGGEGFRESDDLEDLEWGDEIYECDTCDGEGGWAMCLGRCDKDGIHTVKAPPDTLNLIEKESSDG